MAKNVWFTNLKWEMMENKNSFVLYADAIHVVRKLSDEKAGQLFKLVLAYVNDENPETNDPLLEIAFEPIKQQLKRDLKRWESIREKRADAGRLAGIKSGESRRKKTNQNEPNEPNEPIGSKTNQTNQNEHVNDIVNVNVNDNVINTSKVNFDHVDILNHYNNTFKKQCRVFAATLQRGYLARLRDGYSIEQIKTAMVNASKDDFHRETLFKHCTLAFFSRADKIDKFAFLATTNKTSNYNPNA